MLRQPAATLLVLVGIPGSGKTTLAQQLCSSNGNWEWINQDTLGDRRLCEQAVREALARGRSPIIDRCNFDDRQRSTWLRLAQEACTGRVHTVAVQLLLPLELCIERVKQRLDHPTLNAEVGEDVCRRFFADFVMVQRREGFSQVLTVTHAGELLGITQQLQALVAPPAAAPLVPPAQPLLEPMGQRWAQPPRSPAWQQQQQQPSPWQQHQQQQQPAWQQGPWVQPSSQHPVRPPQQQTWGHAGGGSHIMPGGGHAPWVTPESGCGAHGPDLLAEPAWRGHAPQLVPEPGWRGHASQLVSEPGRGGPGGHRGRRTTGGRRSAEDEAEEAEAAKLFADPRSQVPYDEPHAPSPLLPSTTQQQQDMRQGQNGHQVAVVDLTGSTNHGEIDLTDQQDAHGQQAPGEAAQQLQPSQQAAELLLPLVPRPVSVPDQRIILLFDLNGTLTSHTSQRYSSGINKVRPHIELLRQLMPMFRLGIFTSATVRTVAAVRVLLEAAAGVELGRLFEPGLILYREHTIPAPPGHVAGGAAKRWDTVKPLARWFKRPHRVVLFDDDAHKAAPGEQAHLVHVPCWDDKDDSCCMIKGLVEAVQQVLGPLGVDADVSGHTATITARLMAIRSTAEAAEPAAAEAAEAEAAQEQLEQGEEPAAKLVKCSLEVSELGYLNSSSDS